MNNNFKLNIDNVNQKVHLAGWVKKSRRLGDLIFIDLRKMDEIVQIVVKKEDPIYEITNSLRSEYVIEVKGTVVERKDKNSNIPSGDIEISASDIVIVSKAKQTPMIIDDETDALEPIRMEYRYLDIRRPIVKEMLIQRSNINKIIRNYFLSNEFIEIETPIITKPTPGGANELKVLSANHLDKYYSLVQSPQIYKQLLMYGGIDKYFQIAKSFRDEDSRKDRQLEFTQIDLEVAFTNEEEIQGITERLLKDIWKESKGIDIKIPFERMTYQYAIDNYGSDKPDTRFENKLVDLSDELKDSEINFISNAIKGGSSVIAVGFEEDIQSKSIKQLEKTAQEEGASGLAWIRIEDGKLVNGSIKLFTDKEIADLSFKIGKTTTILFTVGEKKLSQEIMGRVRISVAQKFNLTNAKQFNFLWITAWPLFEKNKEGKLESAHNPFTAVANDQIDNLMNGESEGLFSRAYDVVLNGNEIGGGSIRFNNLEQQYKAFEIMGLGKEEIDENFGWFLEAFEYGIPYHGGIALGIDRILAIMFNKNSIRDVIAFPKSTKGTDEMTKAPIDLKGKN